MTLIGMVGTGLLLAALTLTLVFGAWISPERKR